MFAPKNAPVLNTVFEKATSDVLVSEDIAPLSIDSRCRLITQLVDYLKAQTQHDILGMVSSSLRCVSKSFAISDDFYDITDKRRERFLIKLKEPRNQEILDVVRHWGEATMMQRQAALVESTKLQQRVYLEGIADVIPFDHHFYERGCQVYMGRISWSYGSFVCNPLTGKAAINQNMSEDVGFHDAGEALDTAHHEMTHGIHFTLGMARRSHHIADGHPLHEDARYFESLHLRKAYIPTLFSQPYIAQTHEFLAFREGEKLSDAIIELAHA